MMKLFSSIEFLVSHAKSIAESGAVSVQFPAANKAQESRT